mmetsp:Transcript_22404/g.43552  ORF Transcript_22404/g.43552 Transcript_22404/m.43552 type:complete len:310 (-) Transcript_22404:472-1401(-)
MPTKPAAETKDNQPGVGAIKLSNGVEVPALGFGTAFGNWTDPKKFSGFLPEQAYSAIPMADAAGYQHFDCARAYGTERHLGMYIAREMMAGRRKREDFFITTKLAHPDAPPHVNISHRNTFNMATPGLDLRNKILDDFDDSLSRLGVGQVDLLLMHWPGDFGSKDKKTNRSARIAIWKTFEELYKKQAVRAIGVCNFTEDHLKELKEDGATTMPMVNQLEINPYCQQKEILAYMKENSIVAEAYAPFASGAGGLLKDQVIVKIGEKYGKNVGQVILRWLVQKGCIGLPKSSNFKRAKGNLEVMCVCPSA